MNVIHLINFLTLFPLFSLATALLMKNRKSSKNITLSLFIFASFLWTLSIYLSETFKNPQTSLFWSKLAIVGPSLMPPLLIHFSWVFPSKKKLSKIFLYLIYLSPLPFIILAPTHYNIKKVIIKDWGISIVQGELYILLLVYLLFFIAYVMRVFIKNYKQTKGIKKLQLFYIIFGFLLAAPIGIIFNLLLVLLGNPRYTSFGTLSALIFSSILTYAVIRHRLMGVKFVLSRVYTYLALTITLFLFYELVIYFNFREFTYLIKPQTTMIGLAFSLFFSFLFIPLYNKIKASSDKLFFKGHNPKEIIKDISIKLNNNISLGETLLFLNRKFNKVIGAQKTTILIIDKKGVFSKNLSLNYIKLKDERKLIKFLKTKNQIIIKEEVQRKKLMINKYFKKFDFNLSIPLFNKNNFIGVIFLGSKENDQAYYQEDIEFLEIISNQTAIAIENALLYESVTDFNKKLQKQVRLKTKKLKQAQLEKITHIYRFAEFGKLASGIIHDLVNPLTALVLNIEFLQKSDYFKKGELAQAKKCLDKAVKTTESMQDLIAAVKKQIKKQEFIQNFDLNKEIAQTIRIFEYKLRKELIKLEFLPKQKIILRGNPLKLNQVISNLIANSIDSFDELKKKDKRITVKTQTQGSNKALISVKDNGPGIDPKLEKKIFEPLFTTKEIKGTG
ncbi:MAG: hypothetical protein GF335_04030, partial [Candidatus Moranbacteria bacterium]|nr:hypothetical protein [Candidatus Moranbacteria bacterium]